jgi:hypothetical protein
MKRKILHSLAVASLLLPAGLLADTIKLKTGEPIEGIIQKIEKGKVTVQVGGATRELSILDIDEMDFDTPHLTESTAKLPLDHFLKDLDAQEMVRLSRDLKQAKKEVDTQLDSIKKNWQAKQPVDKDQARRWSAAKETFQVPMKRYQEVVREIYMHALAQVEEYNKVADQADKIYVGVKGVFNVGSPLLTEDLEEITAKKVVPKSWYDRIFYAGYNRGYKDGATFERLIVIPPAAGTPSEKQP